MKNAKKNFPQIVAVLTLVLIVVSIVMTFVGAFTEGALGEALLFAGIFCFVAFAIFGWLMISLYKWAHRNDDADVTVEEVSEEN